MTWEVELIIAGALVIIGLDLVLIWLYAINQELLRTIKQYNARLNDMKKFKEDANGLLRSITESAVWAADTLKGFDELYHDMVELSKVQNRVMLEISKKEREVADKINLDLNAIEYDETEDVDLNEKV